MQQYSPVSRRRYLGDSNSPNVSPTAGGGGGGGAAAASSRRTCDAADKENNGAAASSASSSPPPVKRARKSLAESLSSPEPRHYAELSFPHILTPETPVREGPSTLVVPGPVDYGRVLACFRETFVLMFSYYIPLLKKRRCSVFTIP